MLAFGVVSQRNAAWPQQCSSRVARRALEQIHSRTPLSEPDLSDQIALESVDIVPLPSPVVETAPAQRSADLSLDSFVSLDKTGEDKNKGFFSLDKTQSLWLLNAVSLVYGTNTTCAFQKPLLLRGKLDLMLRPWPTRVFMMVSRACDSNRTITEPFTVTMSICMYVCLAYAWLR
jgi:hypothetical protein